MSEIQVDAPIEDSGSLSEFEAQYHPRRGQEPVVPSEPVQTELPTQEVSDGAEETPEAKAERDRNKDGTFAKGKHRAESQKASAADAPRIQKLTAQRKEAEERATALEARIRELESVRSEPTRADRAIETLKSQQVAEFDQKEPTLDQFKDAEDPYAAWIRAVARYDLKKEQFEERQKAKEAEAEEENRGLEAEALRIKTAYDERIEEASKEKYPDLPELMQKHAKTNFTPVMQAMVMMHDEGPDIVYYLLTHPGELAGIRLLTRNQPAYQEHVADAMEWLNERRTQVGQTGSTASAPRKYSPPPPPNPVRTVPSGSSSSDEDVESMSLTAFDAKFGKKRARR